MNKGFYPKLAFDNMKKNAGNYIPYILTCIGISAMFYIISALEHDPGLLQMHGSVPEMMSVGSWVIRIFSVIFLFYTNSFLIKKRKKEFGLFNILGMEKRHLAKVMLLETIYTAIVSLVIGLGIGLLLSKLIYLALLQLLQFDVTLGFTISVPAILSTLALFGVIYLLTYLNTLRQIQKAKPIELLGGSQVGEREPKTKWIMTMIGLLTLGGGYYIAVTVEDPLATIFMFFVAVILVMIGTYCLFVAGSVTLLKMLRKNKKFYYKTRHFTSVSGMIYRMKQNAVGLANICILSTAVLVMISTTLCLYIGAEDIIHNRYPKSVNAYIYEDGQDQLEEGLQIIEETMSDHGIRISNLAYYRFFNVVVPAEEGSLKFLPDGGVSDDYSVVTLLTLEDYLKGTDKSLTLAEDEILMYMEQGSYTDSQIEVFGRQYQVKEMLDEFVVTGRRAAYVNNSYYIVLPDRETMDAIIQETDRADLVVYYYGMDTDDNDTAILEAGLDASGRIDEAGMNGYLNLKEEARADFYELYGGLFFLGIFLGLVFLMATILIIYYKQVSEGYDDRERFEIMQKVGMSRKEVKTSIRSQVLTVFYMPLLVAAVHIAFAFPVILRLLQLFGLFNTPLFLICTIGTFVVFAALYAFVYAMTARAYYKIVNPSR